MREFKMQDFFGAVCENFNRQAEEEARAEDEFYRRRHQEKLEELEKENQRPIINIYINTDKITEVLKSIMKTEPFVMIDKK